MYEYFFVLRQIEEIKINLKFYNSTYPIYKCLIINCISFTEIMNKARASEFMLFIHYLLEKL